ncbi:MAG: hypothetical protein V4731_18770 [Pseudomonadota bacterium]
MKPFLIASAVLLAPALVWSQSAEKLPVTKAAAAAPKPAAAPAAKSPAKPVAKTAAKAKPEATSRVDARSTAKQLAAGISAAEDALGPEELAIAERIHVGTLPCELGASVTLASDPKSPGYFDVQGKNFKFRMFPVTTATGAIRLEDRRSGAVWLQLANKSMLMNQKAGQRMADECMSPAQIAVAQHMKTNPAPGLLDAPKPVVAPAIPAAPATPVAAPSAAPALPALAPASAAQ